MNQRIRDYGFISGQLPAGRLNLISDVPGVTVGHLTNITGNDVRTGITVINPSADNVFRRKLPAGVAVGNGFGKSTGTTQIVELGTLETPIALTNTHAVGPVLRGVVELVSSFTPDLKPYESINAVVGETNDWIVNDIHAASLTPADVTRAWESRTERFLLGSVGAGTGTRAFSWKGGIGSASRTVMAGGRRYAVGALVQTNFGGDLTIMGRAVGRAVGALPSYTFDGGHQPDGSCMIVLATDAPLSSRQLTRLARRGLLGLARTGSVMANSSGDYAFAFSTDDLATNRRLDDDYLNPFFLGAVESVEESIYDAMFTAETVTGRTGNRLDALPVDEVVDILKRDRS